MNSRETFRSDYRDARTGFWAGLASKRMIRATACRWARKRYDGLAIPAGVAVPGWRLDAARVGPRGKLP
jgi:hypothetical protein